MMYHIEYFNSNVNQGELEQYFQEVALPYLRDKGFEVYLFATQFGLGRREYCFITAMDKFSSIDSWEHKARGDAKGKEIMKNLEKIMKNTKANVVKDLEDDFRWIKEPHKMYHMELFNSIAKQGELESFFINEALPYLREKGFHVKLLKTQHELGPAEFWFITQMDNFASIDKWPEMTSSDDEGRRIMKKLISIIDVPIASIVKDISKTSNIKGE